MYSYRTIRKVLAVLAAVVSLAACSGAPGAASSQAQPGVTQATPTAGTTTPSAGPTSTPGPGGGPGMGPGRGPGMGPGMAPGMGPGMGGGYGHYGPAYNQDNSPVTMDEAVDIANRYLASTGYTNLETAEVHEFTNGFEAEYAEKGSNIHAFQILIDNHTGAAFSEMGPNMMWNTKYSPMGGPMGHPSVQATTNMPVSAETAHANAQSWLNSNMPGTTVETDVDTAYGYYEMMVLEGGKPSGEIDVNGYNGQVWYENWHGPLVQTRQVKSGGQ